MKSEMQQLVDAADKLCATLDRIHENEMNAVDKLKIEFEYWRWEAEKMRSEITELYEVAYGLRRIC